ncbi:hypothetical protein BG003_003211 [Podila horticola]|nr:hypothetical protein BG003_003211 [Podila horticola]
MAEKSEYADYPKEKTDTDRVDVEEDQEEDEFVHEEQQFTWRASIIGSLLGLVVAASNMYLGLKIGWSFGAALWGSIFGFLILKALSKVTGTVFGPKENAVCQAAATSAGGLSSGFVTAIPAMYRLGLMGDSTPSQDFVPLFLWTICSAFFGMFFAIPLRAHFVVNQDLVFPTPRAAAETIKNLHRAGSSAAKDAKNAGIAMLASFCISMVWGILAYFISIFESIHFLWWIGKAAGSEALMKADQFWNWFFAWDFAFFGAGLMSPGNTVFCFNLGQLIAFGIAGPLMVQSGFLFDQRSTGFKYWPTFAGGTAASFFLWPGIAMMIVTAFAEVGAQGPALYHGLKGGVLELRNGIRKLAKKGALVDESNFVRRDLTPEHELIPTTWWVSGLLVSGLMTVLVMYFNFKVPVYATLGSIILAFFLAFVGLQASGETDINPTGAVAKVSQLVFSRIPSEEGIVGVQKTNLMCANIAASVCSQSVDMVSDLKTAYLLKASPKAMFWAQFVGSFFAIIIAVPLFMLYTKAYPCILNENIEKCPFLLSAVLAWSQVCLLLTGKGEIPKEALVLTAILAAVSLLNVIIRVKFVPDAWKPYWPNFNAIGLGFIAPNPSIPIAMAIGWTSGRIWKRVSQESHEKLMYSVSAGLIAGIGMASVVTAAMTIADVKDKVVPWGARPGLPRYREYIPSPTPIPSI